MMEKKNMFTCNIKNLPTSNTYGVPVTLPLFSLAVRVAKNTYEQACFGASCKAWLNDAICSSVINKPSYSRKVEYVDIDFRKTGVLVRYSNSGQALSDSLLALRMLRSLEHHMQFKRSIVKQSKTEASEILYILSSRWLHNPVALSLYTSIIRLATLASVKKILTDNPRMSTIRILREISTTCPIESADINYIRTCVQQGAMEILLNTKFSKLFSTKAKDNFTANKPAELHIPGIQSWSTYAFWPKKFLPWRNWKDITKMCEIARKEI